MSLANFSGQKFYYAHPISDYDQPVEQSIAAFAANLGVSLENPNQPHHQQSYQYWKENTGSGMRYYYEEVLPHCDGVIFTAFDDGSIGAGVGGEVNWFLAHNKPAFLITVALGEGNTYTAQRVTTLSDMTLLSIEATRTKTASIIAARSPR